MNIKPNGHMSVSFMLSIMLVSCGGGGSTSIDTPIVAVPPQMINPTGATIYGTVPGTKIEGYCANGQYFFTESAKNETQQHPFSLTLPVGIDCHIVMTTHDAANNAPLITPLSFRHENEIGHVINISAPLNLGHVPLPMSFDALNTIFGDINKDNVADRPLQIDIVLDTGIAIRTLSVDPMDKNNNGIPNVYDDDDHDGIYNKMDEDDDNDGTKDDEDEDDHDSDDAGIDITVVNESGKLETLNANVLTVIPDQKASPIIFENSLNTNDWAPINPLTYESTLASNIYIIGDSQSSTQPKSGHMANSQAKVCADAVLRSLNNLPIYEHPKTNSACYSPVSSNEASWLTAVYDYNASTQKMQLVPGANYPAAGKPSKENYNDMFNWSGNLFADTFK